MNHWARIQLGIVTAGTLLFLATGLQGLAVDGGQAGFPLHTRLGLVATLLIVLGETWIVVYLAACARRLPATGLTAEEARALGRSARGTSAVAGAAAAAALAHLIWAGRGFSGGAPASRHGLFALATALLLLGSILVAARGLGRHQRLAESFRADRRVLDSLGS